MTPPTLEQAKAGALEQHLAFGLRPVVADGDAVAALAALLPCHLPGEADDC